MCVFFWGFNIWFLIGVFLLRYLLFWLCWVVGYLLFGSKFWFVVLLRVWWGLWRLFCWRGISGRSCIWLWWWWRFFLGWWVGIWVCCRIVWCGWCVVGSFVLGSLWGRFIGCLLMCRICYFLVLVVVWFCIWWLVICCCLFWV